MSLEKQNSLRRGIEWGSSIALAGVFLFAALPKILDPAAFAAAVAGFISLPWFTVNLVAIFLPWVEVVLAVGLLLPRFRRGAVVGIAVLLLLFTLGIAGNMILGREVACSCFGASFDAAQPVGWTEILRNFLLLALCFVVGKTQVQPLAEKGEARQIG